MSAASVLVADDDEDMRAVLAEELARHGWSVALARDGDEAEGAMRRAAFTVAVLDVRMPGPSGVELLVRLRRRGSTMPVVLITGVTEGLEALGSEHGAIVLAKPFSGAALRAALTAAVAGLGAGPGVMTPS